MSRDGHGRWQSRGAQRFARVVKRESARRVSVTLHVSVATVSALTLGVRQPSIYLATLIESAHGIPTSWWSTAAATSMQTLVARKPNNSR